MKTGGRRHTRANLEARMARFAEAIRQIRKVQSQRLTPMTPLLETGVILGGSPTSRSTRQLKRPYKVADR